MKAAEGEWGGGGDKTTNRPPARSGENNDSVLGKRFRSICVSVSVCWLNSESWGQCGMALAGPQCTVGATDSQTAPKIPRRVIMVLYVCMCVYVWRYAGQTDRQTSWFKTDSTKIYLHQRKRLFNLYYKSSITARFLYKMLVSSKPRI